MISPTSKRVETNDLDKRRLTTKADKTKVQNNEMMNVVTPHCGVGLVKVKARMNGQSKNYNYESTR